MRHPKVIIASVGLAVAATCCTPLSATGPAR